MDFQYKTLLSLDSITKFLTQGERSTAIKMMLQQEAEATEKMLKALAIIDHFKWEPPEFKISQDRFTRFFNKEIERWQMIELYKHPIINEIEKLKQNGHI